MEIQNIKHRAVQTNLKGFDQPVYQSFCEGESLYLAIGYIILEIISTFLGYPSIMTILQRDIKKAEEKALNISSSLYTKGYFSIIESIINTAKVTTCAYSWLKYYAESDKSIEINKFIVDGAKHIIAGLIDPEKVDKIQQVLSRANTKSLKVFIFNLLADSLSIKTILYKRNDNEITKDEFCKTKVGFSYLAFLYEEDENYSIIYTEEHLRMQMTDNYPSGNLKAFPFYFERRGPCFPSPSQNEVVTIPKKLLMGILEEGDRSNVFSQDVRNNLKEWISNSSDAKDIKIAKKIAESLQSILNCFACGNNKNYTEFPNYKCFPRCIICRECRIEQPKTCQRCQRTYDKSEKPE